ncbi:MAG TPA: PDZ domain-containing protein, partial [Roseiflexaceae bacterium]|nr:PDZ domain-containing protein [Roseiflexaceae bacterium]
PHHVQVLVPKGWRVTTGLPTNDQRQTTNSDTAQRSAVGGRWSFVARDYDELVDSPFECGTHRLLEFAVDGIPHEIALWGHGNENEAQIVADTQKIVETARDMFGGLPYERYVFIVHLSDGRGGGLEHRNSVAMLIDRWSFQPRELYERYLGLTAHEFFHVWNVKRIRAEPLGPFDYSRENYTRQLWAMEGVTDHYTELLLLRAGLIDGPRYLEMTAEKIVALQGQPGRAVQSLEQSSFDAWIKLYRPDENTPNSAISYYLKGGLVALLLDLEIRERTGGARSLDDVLRLLYERYPIDGSGIPEDGGYRAAIEQVAPGESFAELFERYIAGADELDYERALGYAGLRLDWKHDRDKTPTWLGIRTKNDNGHVKVTHVLADGPAYAAGIYADDVLLALDGFRIDEGKLKARLAERQVGDSVTLSLFRRDELLQVPVALAGAPPDKLAIVPREDATEQQRRIYEGFIGAWQDPAKSRT